MNEGKAGQQDVAEERVYQEKGKLVKELPEAKVREYLNHPAVSAKVATNTATAEVASPMRLLTLMRRL